MRARAHTRTRLTLVVGRNGSGKSSFVEALEVLLTDESRRWSNREKAWGEGWRNLHHPSPVHIAAEFAVDGVAATTTITKEWTANAALADAQSTAQANKGTHEGYGGDLAALVRDTCKLVDKLRTAP